MREFFEGVRGTVRKLAYPSKKETAVLSVVVIVVSAIAAVVLAMVDTGMSGLLSLFFK